MKKIFLIILCSALFILRADEINYIRNLSNNNIKIVKQAVQEIHKEGKKSISLLILSISSDKKLNFILSNPRSSYFPDLDLMKYNGLLAAYLIEMIIALENIDERNYYKSPFLFGSEKNYIYWDGVIIKKDSNLIKIKDYKNIQKIYEDWWDKNKANDIERLRSDWKKNIKPLSGSKYNWK